MNLQRKENKEKTWNVMHPDLKTQAQGFFLASPLQKLKLRKQNPMKRRVRILYRENDIAEVARDVANLVGSKIDAVRHVSVPVFWGSEEEEEEQCSFYSSTTQRERER